MFIQVFRRRSLVLCGLIFLFTSFLRGGWAQEDELLECACDEELSAPCASCASCGPVNGSCGGPAGTFCEPVGGSDWEGWCSRWETSIAFLSFVGVETPPSPVFLAERFKQGEDDDRYFPVQLVAVDPWKIEGVSWSIIVPLRERFLYEFSCVWLLPWEEHTQSVWGSRDDSEYLVDVAVDILPFPALSLLAIKHDLNCFLNRMDHRVWRKSCSQSLPVMIMPFLGVSAMHVARSSITEEEIVPPPIKSNLYKEALVHDRQNFWGAGPSVGLRSEYLCRSLCTFFGEGGVTFFIGKKIVSQNYVFQDLKSVPLKKEIPWKGEGYSVFPAIQTSIGFKVLITDVIPVDVLAEFRWENYLCAGIWTNELHRMLGINKDQLVEFVFSHPTQMRDFSLQGFSCSVGVAF